MSQAGARSDTDRKFGRCSTRQGNGKRRGVRNRRAEEPGCCELGFRTVSGSTRRTSQEETCVLALEG